MSDDERDAAPSPGQMEMPQGDVIAKGQVAAFFPEPPDVTRWADAERDPLHAAIDVGPNATCSCGWKGSSWVAHFRSVHRGA